MLSNSVLVVTPTSNPAEVIIREQLHEVLEPVPCLPKLQGLRALLKGREYDEGHEVDDEPDDNENRPVSRYTTGNDLALIHSTVEEKTVYARRCQRDSAS